MKPTRHIVKPCKKLWRTGGRVWYQKNDDYDMYNAPGEIDATEKEEIKAKILLEKQTQASIKSEKDALNLQNQN